MELEGLVQGQFSQVEGLGITREVVGLYEGGLNHTQHKLIGRATLKPIILSAGVVNGPALLQWYQDFFSNQKCTRKSGSILILEDSGEESFRINFRGAWPVSWDAGTLGGSSGGGQGLWVERMELAVEGLEKA